MKKEKKAQVTIFIIMGIIIVAGVVSFVMVKQTDITRLTPETEKIYNFVQGCINQAGIDTIFMVGEKGGYYDSNFDELPYYYADGKTYVPTKEQIEQEISFGLPFEISVCINDFENFPDYEIASEEPIIQTEILDNQVIIKTNYPLTITKGVDTTTLKKFKDIRIPIRLGIIHETINEITQNQLKNEKFSIDGKTKEAYCLTCINDIAIKNDLFIDIIEVEEDESSVIFIITDENSKINNESFAFAIANKYQIE